MIYCPSCFKKKVKQVWSGDYNRLHQWAIDNYLFEDDGAGRWFLICGNCNWFDSMVDTSESQERWNKAVKRIAKSEKIFDK